MDRRRSIFLKRMYFEPGTVRAPALSPLEAIMNTTHFVRLRHWRRHSPPVSDSPQDAARADWLYDSTEELLRGGSVSFQRRMRPQQGETAEEFALAVDEYVNNRLANSEVHTSALGWLIISAERGQTDKTATAELLGNSDHREASLARSPRRCLSLLPMTL
jgi:hypothetical protein